MRRCVGVPIWALWCAFVSLAGRRGAWVGIKRKEMLLWKHLLGLAFEVGSDGFEPPKA